MSIIKGQLYLINSFDLGFINILPVDILMKVISADPATNELELAPIPLPGCHECATFLRVARWFEQDYPARSKEYCILKNVSAFEKLIRLKIAVPAGKENQNQFVWK